MNHIMLQTNCFVYKKTDIITKEPETGAARNSVKQNGQSAAYGQH